MTEQPTVIISDLKLMPIYVGRNFLFTHVHAVYKEILCESHQHSKKCQSAAQKPSYTCDR